MRFMLMMVGPAPAPGEGIMSWSKDAVAAHMDYMIGLDRELKNEGVLVDAQGLDYPPKPTVVRATRERKPSITDGPFAETKEHLFGFWIIEVPSREAAYAIAARCSAAPGADGQPLNMPIEVRQVMEGPPDA
jgi:hypothetical protein